ncbi:unnamed protein product, partial [Schistosoma margrebowiei]
NCKGIFLKTGKIGIDYNEVGKQINLGHAFRPICGCLGGCAFILKLTFTSGLKPCTVQLNLCRSNDVKCDQNKRWKKSIADFDATIYRDDNEGESEANINMQVANEIHEPGDESDKDDFDIRSVC